MESEMKTLKGVMRNRERPITKMRKDGVSVSSDVLARISHALGCKIDDIIEILPGVPKKTPTL